MRRLLLTLALVASACSGAGGEDLPGTTVTTTSSSTSTTTKALPATPITKAPGGWHLAWQPTALVDGFADALADIQGVGTVSMVRVGDTRIVETARADGTIVDQPTGGFVIPAEVHAFDPAAHAAFVPDSVTTTFANLADDEIMLGSTSAALRRLSAGDTVTFSDGYTATIAGIIDDDYVGDAEIVTARSDLTVFGRFLDKYAVFWFDGVRDDLEAALGSFDGEPVVLRAWGEPLVFRHGDSVRSQVAFKERFGEFTIRPNGSGFEQERAWREENIVTESIPLLGSVTCHRDFVEMLRQAMTELEDGGSGAVINRGSFQGCWNARFIAGREAISHHSFGAAADVNFYEPADGPFSPTDPDLLVAMYTAGLTSGHVWVNPDPGHFEWFDN